MGWNERQFEDQTFVFETIAMGLGSCIRVYGAHEVYILPQITIIVVCDYVKLCYHFRKNCTIHNYTHIQYGLIMK